MRTRRFADEGFGVALGSIGVLIVVATGSAACGGSAHTEQREPTAPASVNARASAPRQDDGMRVEGLSGTISERAVHEGIQTRMTDFMKCVSKGYRRIDMLGGSIELAFRVRLDGSVAWAFPKSSDVGDRETERCVVDVARRVVFVRPQGGEAEFTHPLSFDPLDDVRPPVQWSAVRLEEVIAERSDEVASACGHGEFVVTSYVDRGGRVLGAGAATTDDAAASKLDCVVRSVHEWTMPDPGSYPAKVTFALSL